MRMLAKKPADRCDSWHALIDELEQIEIKLTNDPNILRKTRGQLQALIGRRGGAAAGDRVEEPRLPSPAPMRDPAGFLAAPPAREASPSRPAPTLRPISPLPGASAQAKDSPAPAASGQLPDWL
jgi:hypothetical protein